MQYAVTISSDDVNVIERVIEASKSGSAAKRVAVQNGAVSAAETAELPFATSGNIAPAKAQRKRNAAQAGVVAEAPAEMPKTVVIPTLTQKEISDAITNLSRKKSLPIAANIVKTTLISAEGEPEKFAVRVGDIPPAMYSQVMSRIEEALGASS